jgi:hypothetical protein
MKDVGAEVNAPGVAKSRKRRGMMLVLSATSFGVRTAIAAGGCDRGLRGSGGLRAAPVGV